MSRCTAGVSFFSERFSWEEPTIVMVFRQCFFFIFSRPPEVTKIILPEVLQNFKFHLLAQGTKPKRFSPFFLRNVHYRARLNGPPFQIFRHCATFYRFFPTGIFAYSNLHGKIRNAGFGHFVIFLPRKFIWGRKIIVCVVFLNLFCAPTNLFGGGN